MLFVSDAKVNQWNHLVSGGKTLRVKPLKVAFVSRQHALLETERMSRNGSTRLFSVLHRTAKITGVNAVGIVAKTSKVAEVFPFAIGFDTRMTKRNAIHDQTSACRVKFAQVIESHCWEGVPIRHDEHGKTLCVEIC